MLREVKEETGVELGLGAISQFRVYSDPKRDHRRHTVSCVFICHAEEAQLGRARSGDDAKGVETVRFADVPRLELAFDHAQILRDYMQSTIITTVDHRVRP